MEDSAGRADVTAEHGLSLWIETASHRILADTGASDATWGNAAALGVDPTEADILFLSHGHYDHTGGLRGLCRRGFSGEIYLHRDALGAFYHGEKYIGTDPAAADLPRLHFLRGDAEIDTGLSVFSGVTGRRMWPEGNRELTELRGGRRVQDPFAHEQYLVIREGGRRVLVSGCAHNGILNILDAFREKYGGCPDAVLSGFHMMKKTPLTDADREMIRAAARELSGLPCVFYTGHCTGDAAFDLMREILGGRLIRLRAGDTLTV